MLKFAILYFLLNFAKALSIFAYQPCKSFHRNGNASDFFHLSCVCDAIYCDEIAHLDLAQLAKGEAIVYRTSLYGKERMMPSKLNWRKNEVDGGDEADFLITVNPYRTYQPILGWGAAFTDTAVHLINTLNKATQDKFMQAYFGDKGLEFNMARIPIAGSDYSLRPFSYNDEHPDDFALRHFAMQPEDSARWKLMHQAQKLIPKSEKLLLVGSPWSAPAWMKTNKMINHGGRIVNNATYWQTWADYFIRFLQAYRSAGFDFYAVTIQNEPNVNSAYNSMQYTPDEERDFVANYLGTTLRRSEFSNSTKLLVSDSMRILLLSYTTKSLDYAKSAAFIDGIAMHPYDLETPLTVNDKIARKYPNKPLISTEFCILDPPDLGNWERGERYLKNLMDNANHHNQAFIDWNLAVDIKGGPSWAGSAFDSLVIINTTSNQFYKQPGFYARAHFSKTVPRHSKRINVKIRSANGGRLPRSSIEPIDATAFLRPDGGRVLIIRNPTETVKAIKIRDRKKSGKITHFIMHPRSFVSIVYR